MEIVFVYGNCAVYSIMCALSVCEINAKLGMRFYIDVVGSAEKHAK